MPLSKKELVTGIISKLRFMDDQELNDILDNLPQPSQTVDVNIAFKAEWIETIEDQPLDFTCGRGDRPNKPPNS